MNESKDDVRPPDPELPMNRTMRVEDLIGDQTMELAAADQNSIANNDDISIDQAGVDRSFSNPPADHRSNTDDSAADVNLAFLQAAQQIGYQVRGVIGRGGMGVVYEAVQLDLDRTVALKTVLTDRLDDPTVADRFRREAIAVARLHHPNIVQAFNFGTVQSYHYFAMELVDGPTCQQWVKQHGPMSAANAWDAIRQTAGGLMHAAKHGVLHRDIKPGNLMILPLPEGIVSRGSLGLIKVTDFGLAVLDEYAADGDRLTGSGHLIGSPAYMAPERFEDDVEIDLRSDLYSLGVTAISLRTGSHPFSGRSLPKLVAAKSSPVDLECASMQCLSGDEKRLLADMLHPEPDLRISQYETLLERIDGLSDIDISESVVTEFVAPASVPGRGAADIPSLQHVAVANRRHRRAWMIVGVTAILISAVAFVIANRWIGDNVGPRSHTVSMGSENLYDGRTLRGFAIGGGMVGSWQSRTAPDGASSIACSSVAGTIARPMPVDLRDTSYRLTLFVSAAGWRGGNRYSDQLNSRIQFAGFDGKSSKISVECRPDSIHIVQQSGSEGAVATLATFSGKVDLRQRPYVVHIERQPHAWYVFVEDQFFHAMPRDPNVADSPTLFRLIVDGQTPPPVFYFSDLQLDRLGEASVRRTSEKS